MISFGKLGSLDPQNSCSLQNKNRVVTHWLYLNLQPASFPPWSVPNCFLQLKSSLGLIIPLPSTFENSLTFTSADRQLFIEKNPIQNNKQTILCNHGFQRRPPNASIHRHPKSALCPPLGPEAMESCVWQEWTHYVYVNGLQVPSLSMTTGLHDLTILSLVDCTMLDRGRAVSSGFLHWRYRCEGKQWYLVCVWYWFAASMAWCSVWSC